MPQYTSPAFAALDARKELDVYGDNKLLLYALELHQQADDIHAIATDALTDHSNDKKCDLVYIEKESGIAIIAQGYSTTDWSKKEAPANKASDLNTAVSWVLSDDLSSLPKGLRSAAEELQDAIASGDVSRLHIWYVHNLPSSKNVERELGKVEQAAKALLAQNFPSSTIENIEALEVGRDVIEQWYLGTQKPILVTETFSFETTGGFSEKGDNWEAYSTSIPASWLAEKYRTYGKKLFAANVRDYLGSRRSDKNINHNIKTTAQESPRQFWAYNNGITALVNGIRYTADDSTGLVEIDGIAIVNGAQTTGSLGSVLNESALEQARVQARFIKCIDTSVVQKIIDYNNSQNKIEATDFRSNDDKQRRLRAEFQSLGTAEYRGGRRGGEEDKIRRPPNLIPSSTAGQSLAAFHGRPDVAYNKKSEIWRSDNLYAEFFSDSTTARHIIFCFTLQRAIETIKDSVRGIPEASRTDSQKKQADYFALRGSVYLMCTAVSYCMESILGKAVPNKFKLQFKKKSATLEQGIDVWKTIVPMLIPFVSQLTPALARGNLKKTNSDRTKTALSAFQSLVESISQANAAQFGSFARLVEIRG